MNVQQAGPSKLKKFGITFAWAFSILVLLLIWKGIPANTDISRIPINLIFIFLSVTAGLSALSGVVGMFVPSRKKPVYVISGVLSIIVFLIVFGQISDKFKSNQSTENSPVQNSESDFLDWIKQQSSETLARTAASELAKRLPMQINSQTLIEGVTSVGSTITMRVKVLMAKDRFIELLGQDGDTLNSYIDKFTSMIHNMGCTQKVNRLYIEKGVEYKYLVSDQENIFLFESSVKKCT